ncbi:MAG: hypothetical protein NTV21_01370 [Planctomycetota bacterium]|nr:hypothetical protein [Planctomycetota bacterium]
MANRSEHLHAEFPDEGTLVRIERALAEVSDVREPLRRAEALRRKLEPETARWAAELAELRERAAARFPSGWIRFATRRALEQSTREPVARERARRIAAVAPGCAVYDATCGLGADARAVSEMGTAVVAADLDAQVARCASLNLAGTKAVVVRADALAPPVHSASMFLVVDPDRRAEGARELDPERWSPPWSALAKLAGRFVGACIKLSPAFDMEQARGGVWDGALAQWTSERGELCEASLWLGVGAGELGGQREAVVLGPGTVGRLAGVPVPVRVALSEKVAGNFWLVDPDPAVVRAGLVGNLGRELGLDGLDPMLAYLVGPKPPPTPLAKAWRVLAEVPADPRKVREALEQHGFGAVEVRKRGHPDPAEELARRFRASGPRRGLVAVARTEAGHRAFVLEP